MSFFSGLENFLGMGNPANAAMPYFGQIPGIYQQYYSPYMQAGANALPQLQNQFNTLMNNPGQFINHMGAGFQQSPGYQFQTQQALNAANRAASAGGMLGTPAEQQSIAGTVNGLANQDYYNWLNHSLGAYGQGLQGEQGLNQMGFSASSDMANSLASALMSQGNLAYAGQANQNQMNGGLFGAGLGFAGNVLGAFL
jgi:hypothetical protein